MIAFAIGQVIEILVKSRQIILVMVAVDVADHFRHPVVHPPRLVRQAEMRSACLDLRIVELAVKLDVGGLEFVSNVSNPAYFVIGEIASVMTQMMLLHRKRIDHSVIVLPPPLCLVADSVIVADACVIPVEVSLISTRNCEEIVVLLVLLLTLHALLVAQFSHVLSASPLGDIPD